MKMFWKIFGIGLGSAAVASLATTTIIHNGKKFKKAFGKKDKKENQSDNK